MLRSGVRVPEQLRAGLAPFLSVVAVVAVAVSRPPVGPQGVAVEVIIRKDADEAPRG